MKRARRLIGLGMIVLLAGGAGGARAGASDERTNGGATGDVRDSAAAKPAPRLERVRAPGGGVKLTLQGRRLHVIEREAGAPGRPSHTCTQSDAATHE